METIARIHSDFPHKVWGAPGRSGLAASLKARVVFEPAYRYRGGGDWGNLRISG